MNGASVKKKKRYLLLFNNIILCAAPNRKTQLQEEMEGTTGSKWVWACVGRRRCGWCVILVVSSTGMHSGCGGIPTCYLNMSQVVSSCWRDLSLQVACSSGQPGSVGARLSEWHLGLLCWLWIWIHVHVGVWPTVYLSLQLRQLRFLYFTCVSSPWNSSLKYGAIVHNYIAPYLTMCWFGHLIKAVVPVAVTSLTQSHPRSTVVPGLETTVHGWPGLLWPLPQAAPPSGVLPPQYAAHT